MKTKIYVSIPITGRDLEEVKAELAEVKTKFEQFDVDVVTPLDMPDWKPDQTWEWYMVRCLDMMAGCNAIYMCDGWKQSAGCRLELEYAKMHNIKNVLVSNTSIMFSEPIYNVYST